MEYVYSLCINYDARLDLANRKLSPGGGRSKTEAVPKLLAMKANEEMAFSLYIRQQSV